MPVLGVASPITSSNVSDLPSRSKVQLGASVIGGPMGKTLDPSPRICDLICDATSCIQFMRQHLNANAKLEK